MDALYVEQSNPVTGAYERILLRPHVRETEGESGVVALTEAERGDLLVIADAFGRRTVARAVGKVRRTSKVVICYFEEEK
jgi:hypothetical protein